MENPKGTPHAIEARATSNILKLECLLEQLGPWQKLYKDVFEIFVL